MKTGIEIRNQKSRKMIISRNHNFENGLTIVRMGRKYLYGSWEKGLKEWKIRRTPKRDMAFKSENFEFLAKEFLSEI